MSNQTQKDDTPSLRCAKCGTENMSSAEFCTSCGQMLDSQKRANASTSSQRQVKNPMTPRAKLIYASIAAVIFLTFGLVFLQNLPGGEHPIIAQQPQISVSNAGTDEMVKGVHVEATVADGKISISLDELRRNRMVEFEYRSSTTTIPLLALISTDGKIITAVRICEPCNSKSFRIEEDHLVCEKCGTTWRLQNFEGVSGACQKYPPDPIPSHVVGNLVVIDESVVARWKMRI